MKNIILSALFIVSAISGLQAQIGINTNVPDSSAAMDIQSPPGGSDNRGVLLPRMSSLQRDSIQNPATSLLVFDTTDNLFYYYDGQDWLGLVPKVPGNGGSTIIKGNVILDSGRVEAPTGVSTNSLNVTGFTTNALVPTGAIMMWSGNPASLPSGWGLCNGNYYAPGGSVFTSPPAFVIPGLLSSPNLSGQFIVGYNVLDADYNAIGDNGGAKEVTLSAAESGMRAHDHGFSGSTSSNTHNHSLSRRGTGTSVGAGNGHMNENRGGLNSTNPTGSNTHSHTFSGTTTDSGASPATNAHENRPPYYTLAYIIKLPY